MPKAGPGPSQGPSDVKFLKCSSNRGVIFPKDAEVGQFKKA